MEANFGFCLTGKYSDTGRVRKANEDSMDVFETANMKVFVVCDGMGGHVGGQVASQTAIAAIKDFMSNHIFTDPCEAIHNSIIAANNAIIQRAQAQSELNGMGSTCVMLVVTSDGKVYYGHIGDSRIYFVANHQITQLTKDHSYVQTLIDEGKISKADAEQHPRKNEITNALGIPDMKPPTLCAEPIEPEAGNCFVLCSDGLSGMIDDQRIEHIVSKHDINIQQRAMKLVEMANAAGGKDNITVQLVEFAVSTRKEEPKHKKTGKKPFLVIGLAVIVVLAALSTAYFIFFGKNKTDKADLNETAQTESIIQAETIQNEIITLPPVLYKKGSELSFNTEIPEVESIVDSRITSGEQFFEIVKKEGRYITIQWKDTDFSNDELSKAEIEISLTTDKQNKYTRRIKIDIPEQPSASPPPRTPAPQPSKPPAPAPSTPKPAPPAQTPSPPAPAPQPAQTPPPSMQTPAPSGETQDNTNPAEPKTPDEDETGSKPAESGCKGAE
jgi:serine/threonine protein phosphatase PrpC